MFSSFSLLFRNPALRILTFILLLTGFTFAATQPYLSVVAVKELGMSDSAFSIVLFLYALANLTVGVTLSIVSDMLSSHRRMFMVTSLAGIIGFGAIYVFANTTAFLLMTITLIPISNAAYGIVFSTLPRKAPALDAKQTGSLITSARTIFSAAWVVIPGLVGLLLVNSPSMLGAWAISALAAIGSFLLSSLFMREEPLIRDGKAEPVTFFASLKLIGQPSILAQVAFMAMVMASQRLSVVLSPLILLSSAHGRMTDVGFLAGALAFLEIPFMLMWSMVLRRLPTLTVLALGATCFCLYLLLLSQASTPWHFYALLLPNACGAAAILSLPMVYFQDLLRDRPGLGISLFQSNTFVSNGFSAGIFAIGAHFFSYSHTAWLAAAMALVGVIGLSLSARRRGVTA